MVLKLTLAALSTLINIPSYHFIIPLLNQNNSFYMKPLDFYMKRLLITVKIKSLLYNRAANLLFQNHINSVFLKILPPACDEWFEILSAIYLSICMQYA
jgi:hypothetical protein